MTDSLRGPDHEKGRKKKGGKERITKHAEKTKRQRRVLAAKAGPIRHSCLAVPPISTRRVNYREKKRPPSRILSRPPRCRTRHRRRWKVREHPPGHVIGRGSAADGNGKKTRLRHTRFARHDELPAGLGKARSAGPDAVRGGILFGPRALLVSRIIGRIVSVTEKRKRDNAAPRCRLDNVKRGSRFAKLIAQSTELDEDTASITISNGFGETLRL